MFQPARGTRDFLPEEMRKRNWVLDNIRDVFEVYGYEPLGTPAFESWDMLKVKSGEDAINQIYYFKDKSNRELGLRFEWTASSITCWRPSFWLLSSSLNSSRSRSKSSALRVACRICRRAASKRCSGHP